MFSTTVCITLVGKLEDALPDHVDPELPDDCARVNGALGDVASGLHLIQEDQTGPSQ